jgi:hypothetical protein
MGLTCNDVKNSRKVFEHIDVPDVFIEVNTVFICFLLVYFRLNFIFTGNQHCILMHHFSLSFISCI